MADGPLINVDDLGLQASTSEVEPINLRQVRDKAEYDALMKALARVDGNVVKAAELLGVSRPTIYDLMNRHRTKTIISQLLYFMLVNDSPWQILSMRSFLSLRSFSDAEALVYRRKPDNYSCLAREIALAGRALLTLGLDPAGACGRLP